MEATEFYDWEDKRHTGMNLTWRYYSHNNLRKAQYYTAENSRADYRFAGNNRQFIKLANILHQQGVTQQLEDSLASNRIMKKWRYTYEDPIISGFCFDESFQNFLNTTSDDNEEISEDTLKTAVNIYFTFGFCPDHDLAAMQFYVNIFSNSEAPPETILQTLARYSFAAKEKNQDEQHSTAKAVFQKAAGMLNLQYKDIAFLTMRASELELYPELENLKPDRELIGILWKQF